MNPEERAEYWRIIDQRRYDESVRAKANPNEGDVVHDVFGTQVYMNGTWNVIGQMKPEEVDKLRKDWLAMAQRKRATENLKNAVERMYHSHIPANTDFGRADLGKYSKVGLNVSHSVLDEHRGIDIGKSLGAHMHLPEEKETVHILTESELDNTTLESYNQGRRNFGEELLQLLAAEEEQLKSYGRTELYGIHKAVSVIHKALSEIQQEELVEQAQN